MSGSRYTWNFHSAGQLVFGTGAIRELPALLQRRKLSRVLIITDKPLVAVGVAKQLEELLTAAGIAWETFDEGEAEPSLKVAETARSAAHEFAPDCVLGLGGGSNMDLAKITAALYTHGGEPAQLFGFDNVPGPVMPLVCVPTTAGTGSEVSHAAVLTDTVNQIKVSILSQHLRPQVALVDPLLTLSCPRKATADSGIDALTHAIEAFTAINYTDLDIPAEQAVPYNGKSPIGDCLAERAIQLIGQHLVTAVNEPTKHAAREGMALAATLAGLAFSNCAVAVVHALEYPIGGVLHCSHGAGNGLLLPHVMRFNLPARHREFARIAELLGVNITGLSEDDAAQQAIFAVERLRADIGIPARLREIGGTEDQLPMFAEKAYAIKRLMLTNPRLPSEADLLEILRWAL